MTESPTIKKRSLSADWLVQGVLTKLGDAFDRITGRSWKPSSSLATSELIEKLKSLVDAEARAEKGERKYVPHNIKLKMQWDKFSTDSGDSLKKLEIELLTALIDHINDCRYYTYAPITLTVRPDYFTDGVKLFASFDSLLENESERSVEVAVPGTGSEPRPDAAGPTPKRSRASLTLRFTAGGRAVEKDFELEAGGRLSVGRTKENNVWIDDVSVSKSHASLVLNSQGCLLVADTGSTNGTFVDDERISYGKAVEITPAQELKFGSVNVTLEVVELDSVETAETVDVGHPADTETFSVGEFEFTSKSTEPAETGPETEQTPSPQNNEGSHILTPLAPERAAPAATPAAGDTDLSEKQ